MIENLTINCEIIYEGHPRNSDNDAAFVFYKGEHVYVTN